MIHSREVAIQQVISQAAVDDIVVLAGKGHEQYQEVLGERLLFSDVAVASDAMNTFIAGPEEVSND